MKNVKVIAVLAALLLVTATLFAFIGSVSSSSERNAAAAAAQHATYVARAQKAIESAEAGEVHYFVDLEMVCVPKGHGYRFDGHGDAYCISADEAGTIPEDAVLHPTFIQGGSSTSWSLVAVGQFKKIELYYFTATIGGQKATLNIGNTVEFDELRPYVQKFALDAARF